MLAARPPVAARATSPAGWPPASAPRTCVAPSASPSPWAGRCRSGGGPVPRFGAAAGYTHPGDRVLRRRVAARRARASRPPSPAPVASRRGPIRGWCTTPSGRRELRRTRRLHDYGLEVLLRLDQDELATFFDAFFDLPIEVWAPYLRVDASAARGQPDDDGGAAATASGDASAVGGRPPRRLVLSDLRTANTHPTTTAAEKMNHWTAYDRCGPSVSSGSVTGSGNGVASAGRGRGQLDEHRHRRAGELRREAGDVEPLRLGAARPSFGSLSWPGGAAPTGAAARRRRRRRPARRGVPSCPGTKPRSTSSRRPSSSCSGVTTMCRRCRPASG